MDANSSHALNATSSHLALIRLPMQSSTLSQALMNLSPNNAPVQLTAQRLLELFALRAAIVKLAIPPLALARSSPLYPPLPHPLIYPLIHQCARMYSTLPTLQERPHLCRLIGPSPLEALNVFPFSSRALRPSPFHTLHQSQITTTTPL